MIQQLTTFLSAARVLVIGAGSIGERHLRVFRQVGARVVPLDVHAERVRMIAERYGCPAYFSDLSKVPLKDFQAAVIATPADSHIALAHRCIEAGLGVLVEKPFSASLGGIDDLIHLSEQKQLCLAVAYVLRFHPVVLKMREILRDSVIGRLTSVHAICTHHVADARPDYINTYFCDPSMGGGVILDLSHEVNYVEWLVGPLELEDCQASTIAELRIPTEGVADLRLRGDEGLRATIHLHAADREPRRRCYLAGEKGTLRADLLQGEVSVEASSGVTLFDCSSDIDSWYRDQARDFLTAITAGRSSRCTPQEALRSLKISLAALDMAGFGMSSVRTSHC